LKYFSSQVRVFSLQFSPTGQQWAAATTEGLLVYSLSSGLIFDPWDLQMGITPEAVKNSIRDGDHLNGELLQHRGYCFWRSSLQLSPWR
jgi:hypothetical protein